MVGILVRDVMHKDVVTCGPSLPLREVASLMVDNHVGSAVVVTGGIVQGMVTERDLLQAVAERETLDGVTVADVMTRYVYSVTPAQSVQTAIALMTEHRIKKLPVMDGRRLVGIVTATDIIDRQPDLMDALKVLMKGRKA
ncbi:MAG: CBS domain-containing protein [Candidatus Aenigmarchaeota archaeon]|nr:CBS domain-containing protein [Candidatus Aenigmarchaeota archaeon]